MSRTVGAAQFKARCLKLMDQVAATGNPLVITKHGKPVACLVPIARRPASAVGALRGHIRIKGDIVAPLGVRWEASRSGSPSGTPPAGAAPRVSFGSREAHGFSEMTTASPPRLRISPSRFAFRRRITPASFCIQRSPALEVPMAKP